MQHTTDQRPTTTQLAGFNAEWKPSSKFRRVFDAYWSQAVNDNKGRDTQETYEFLAQPEYTVSFPATGAPVFDLMGSSLTDPKNIQQNLWISGTANSGAYVQAVNRRAKADFDWHPNPGLHFKFGASYGDQRKNNASYDMPRSSDINNLYHYLRGPTQSFPQSVISGVVYPGTAFGESQSNAYPVFVLDENALRASEADPANLAARARNYAGSNCAYDPQCTLAAFVANGSSWATTLGNNSAYTIDEKDFGAYGELVKDFRLGEVPVNVVAGLRYSRTDVSSVGVTTATCAITLLRSSICRPCIITDGNSRSPRPRSSKMIPAPAAISVAAGLEEEVCISMHVIATSARLTRPSFAARSRP